MSSKEDGVEEHRRYKQQSHIFDELYPRVEELLEKFGRPKYIPGQPPGDFAVHGDYSGQPQVVVFVSNLEMLRPVVVAALQKLVTGYPGWEISMTVAVYGQVGNWPNMGLYIRPHEILDGLQRQYFPKEFQDIEYEGARRGTADD